MRLAASLGALETNQVATLQALSAAVDAKDHYTARHSMHVADYACAICLGLGRDDCLSSVEQGGLLHDIGKIGIPDAVLLKPSRLTAQEYEIVKQHALAAAEIVGSIRSWPMSCP